MVDWRALDRALRHLAGQPLAGADELRVLEGLCERAAVALEAAGVGVLLTDEQGGLRHAAASEPLIEQIERFQEKSGEGPGWLCVESASPVTIEDVASERRWPALAELAAEGGIRSVVCFPIVSDSGCLGALTVAREHPGEPDADEAEAGEALGGAAAAFLRNTWDYAKAVELTQQLETALRSRIVIEQAKGMLAARLGMTPDEAFALLRRTARNRRRRLHDLSRDLIAGVADIDR